MQTKVCPECGDDIYVKAVRHKCGWQLVPAKGAAVGVTTSLRNRCAWVSDGERCRYLGTMVLGGVTCGETVQGADGKPHAVATNDLFCTEHAFPSSLAFAAQVVAESRAKVPAGYDYSTKAIIARVRARYFDGGDPERQAIQNEGQWDTH